MYSHFANLPQTLQVRLSCVIWGLTQTVLARAPSGVMPHWMLQAFQLRVSRIGQVMAGLLLAMQAGTLRNRRSPAPGGTRKPAARSGIPTMRLPGQYGWLVKKLAWHVTGFGSQLQHLLADPEMQALLEVSPRAVRTLKPLCRMLMIPLPLPPVPTPPAPPAPPASIDGDGPVRQRRPPPSASARVDAVLQSTTGAEGFDRRRRRKGRTTQKMRQPISVFARPICFG